MKKQLSMKIRERDGFAVKKRRLVRAGEKRVIVPKIFFIFCLGKERRNSFCLKRDDKKFHKF